MSSFYYYFLNEPITIDDMRGLYASLAEHHPRISMSLPFEDMVSSSFNINEFFRSGGRGWGTIQYGDSIRIIVSNCDIGGSTGFNHHFPHLQKGIRQLKVQFDAEFYIHGLVQEDNGLGEGLLPILVDVARHSNPFFGYYCDESDLDLVADKTFPREIDHLRALFERNLGIWGSLYLDEDLAREIGTGLMEGWALGMTAVDDLGHYYERSGIPMFGSIRESDTETFYRKNQVFGSKILPSILSRMEVEFSI
jgi:hypothetical protein